MEERKPIIDFENKNLPWENPPPPIPTATFHRYSRPASNTRLDSFQVPEYIQATPLFHPVGTMRTHHHAHGDDREA